MIRTSAYLVPTFGGGLGFPVDLVMDIKDISSGLKRMASMAGRSITVPQVKKRRTRINTIDKSIVSVKTKRKICR